MTKVLIGYLRGRNEIAEASANNERQHGVSVFPDFIDSLGLKVQELSPVLKVPLRDLQILYDSRGYINGDSQNNIMEYINAKNAVEDFKKCQHGELELEVI